MKRFLRKPLIVLYALVLAGAGTGIFMLTRGDASSAQYRTVQAALGTVTQTVSLSGNLAPVDAIDLDFSGAGKVTAVDVQPGQTVTAGQALAMEDPTSLSAALSQAQAVLAAAQAKLSLDQAGATASQVAQAQGQVNTAKVQLQIAETSLNDTIAANALAVQQAQQALATAQSAENTDCNQSPPAAACPQDQQTVAMDTTALQNAKIKQQQGNDQAQGQVNSARVQVQNAQAALAALDQGTPAQQISMDESQVSIDQVSVTNAQDALAAATLTAPADGVVEEVNVTVGEQLSAGGSSGASAASSGSATHAVVLITPGQFEVSGSVSDALVNEIAVGQSAEVVAAGSSAAVPGKVTQVAEEATVSSGVATFPVAVVLTGTSPSLRPGMSASVSVIVNQVIGVTTVPTSAVHTTSAGSTVTLLVSGRAQTLAVTVGASDATRTQILSGVNVGDQVVIATVTSTIPSATSGTGSRGFGGGAFGGGGFGGGGITAEADVAAEIIRLADVTKVYGSGDATVRAVNGVSLSVNEGDFLAVVGPSGSGKSTLMHILGCLDTPTSGEYRFAGEDVSRMNERRLAGIRNRRIGFVFQQFHLLTSMSAWRNVELPLLYRSAHDRKQLALEALGRVGLSNRVHHRPNQLSGGQQQRVAIARALVTEPAMILADEPTGNLNSKSSHEVLGILAGLNRAGHTVVLITHEPDIASIARRVIEMRDGRAAEAVAA